jgi:hypothetical protein
MKCVKRFALTLLVSVMATTAYAGGGKRSLFHCGLQLGGTTNGTTKVHKAYSAPKKNQGYGTNQVVKSIDSNGPGVTTFTGFTSNHIGRRRMPSTLTFAKVGCSWR